MVKPRSIGYIELLRRNHSFRRLFWARSVSLFGDWFNTLAILAILDQIQGHRAQAFGWVLILKLFPLLVMGPAAGVVADRFDRKAILIWTDALRVVAVLGFLSLSFWPSLKLLYALTVLQISISAFFEPARTACLAQICDREELVPANALHAVTWSIMLTLGAAMGGLASHVLGWQVAIVIDAATYLVSAILIVPIRVPPYARRERQVGLWHALGLGDAVDGFRYMFRNPPIATVIWAKGAWGVGGAVTLLLTIVGQRVYPVLDSAVLGMTLFYSARGLGTALGPILSRRLVNESSQGMSRAVGASFVVAALFYLAFGSVRSLPLALLFVVLAHLGGSTIWVFSTVMLQRSVPTALQGRVFAAELALFTLTFSISTYVYGYLLDTLQIDPFVLMQFIGWSFLVPGCLWSLAAFVWPLRDAPDAPEPGPTGPPLEEARGIGGFK